MGYSRCVGVVIVTIIGVCWHSCHMLLLVIHIVPSLSLHPPFSLLFIVTAVCHLSRLMFAGISVGVCWHCCWCPLSLASAGISDIGHGVCGLGLFMFRQEET